jgi:hypothetical protein
MNWVSEWSGYQDSNLGPPAPKAGALPDCATSRNFFAFTASDAPPDSKVGMRYRTALHPETLYLL